MKTFVTSDLHFFHHNILAYTNRHKLWKTVDEMNEALIENWNEVVGRDDMVYIIGDVALGGKSRAPELAAYLRRLNGKKYLIPGNHDSYILENPECLKELTVLPPLVEIRIPHPDSAREKHLTVVMSHYPLLVWNKAGKTTYDHDGNEVPTSICVHGHSHTETENIYTGTTRIDIGLDGNNYYPWDISDVYNYLKCVTYKQVDHHSRDTSHAR